MSTPLLHSIPNAVIRSGVSRTGLYMEKKAGRLHFVKIGRRTYIADEELERFVKQLVTDAESHTPEEAV